MQWHHVMHMLNIFIEYIEWHGGWIKESATILLKSYNDLKDPQNIFILIFWKCEQPILQQYYRIARRHNSCYILHSTYCTYIVLLQYELYEYCTVQVSTHLLLLYTVTIHVSRKSSTGEIWILIQFDQMVSRDFPFNDWWVTQSVFRCVTLEL